MLRVGATPQVIENLLAGFLPRYRKRHPGVDVCLVEDGGARLPGRLERGDLHIAIMPAGEDRFQRPIALSNASLGRAAAETPLEPPRRARSGGARRGTAAAPHSRLRVAWLVRGCLPDCAHPAARAARKRRSSDADRIGAGRSRHCRGSLSGADSAHGNSRGRGGASPSADRSMDGSPPGIRSSFLAPYGDAICRGTGWPLRAWLSGQRIRSARAGAAQAKCWVGGQLRDTKRL